MLYEKYYSRLQQKSYRNRNAHQNSEYFFQKLNEELRQRQENYEPEHFIVAGNNHKKLK